jgi:peptidoglycan/xylan/chitin deacetylase (PgdA/CDA1 family)
MPPVNPVTAGPKRDFVGYGRHAPRAEWPGGAVCAINMVICYEEGSEYNVIEGDNRNDGWGEYPTEMGPDVRDLGTETHFEYGSRVGMWRLARLFDRLKVPVTISACAVALERNPEVAAWIAERGHDVLGHGLRWSEYWTMPRDEERRQMKEAHAVYARFGLKAEGWNCRSFPSVNTEDLIVEDGSFLYYSDPCNDDLPYFVETGKAGAPLLVVPYSKTLNDSRYLMSPGYAEPGDFVENCKAAIDYVLGEAPEIGGRMLTIALHARWSGQPSRADAVRRILELGLGRSGVVFMHRAEIARWWLANHQRFAGFNRGYGMGQPGGRSRPAILAADP